MRPLNAGLFAVEVESEWHWIQLVGWLKPYGGPYRVCA
ncbi:hypothetical protein P186_1678 [Pyrobaculum ferrireducens]|uniref:Uncharacterized protein n=1 Tax=Pyrobaculum ferrireducens TaxID=1104324 RepID=G7VGJ2_9CREN|nr:hypothetical protein P186_1678 [Pyrobaculum ferrireducens]